MIDWRSWHHRAALMQLAVECRMFRLKDYANLIEYLLQEGWVKQTTRNKELAITELGQRHVQQILAARWPEWRDMACALSESGIGISARSLQLLGKREVFNMRIGARLPAILNRKTFNAALALHSKAANPEKLREAFPHVQLAGDNGILIRTNPGFRLCRGNAEFNCDDHMAFMGVVYFAERAVLGEWRVGGVLPRAVLTVENPGSFHDVALPEGVLAVLVEGWNTPVAAKFLLAFPESIPHIHFGDYDPAGISILQHLRMLLSRPIYNFAPDFALEYIDTHSLPFEAEDSGWSGTPRQSSTSALVDELRHQNKWLEQEAITLDERLPDALNKTVQQLIEMPPDHS